MSISCNIHNRVTKPAKAPLTAYNLYFQVERKRILEGTDSLGFPITKDEMEMVAAEFKAKAGQKRLHRRTHGKIGFKELAGVVANRWKKLDSASKDTLIQHARIEKAEHTAQLQEWKKSEEIKHGQDRQAQAKDSYLNPSKAEDSHPGIMSDLELFRAMWKEHESKTLALDPQKDSRECFIALPQVFPEQQKSSQASLLSPMNGGSRYSHSFFDDRNAPAVVQGFQMSFPWKYDHQQSLYTGLQDIAINADMDLLEPMEPTPLFGAVSAQPTSSSHEVSAGFVFTNEVFSFTDEALSYAGEFNSFFP